jgi:DNA-directed RNA polymerase subunit RPC12/RpoP
MDRCPNCGAWSIIGSNRVCYWCGKVTCKKCLSEAVGFFLVKQRKETREAPPPYGIMGFCSEDCSDAFWQRVMGYSFDDIGTESARFVQNLRKLWHKAIIDALEYSPRPSDGISKVKRAILNDSPDAHGVPLGIRDDGTLVYKEGHNVDFINREYAALARNLEKCGRPLDAADIYERNLKLYDKARALREMAKHVIVKQTDIRVDLNKLLQQLKDGGIVVLYRCPNCNATLKINKDTSVESLRTCEHCGSEIGTMNLADFLKTALS